MIQHGIDQALVFYRIVLPVPATQNEGSGQACTGTDPNEFKYGPYLKDDLPVNPLGTNSTVTVVTAGVLGLTSGSLGGWRFDSVTGEFIGDE